VKNINGICNRKEFESYGLLNADYATTLFFGITSFARIIPELIIKGISGKSSGFDMRFLITPTESPELDIIKIRNVGGTGS
jgi:hypothetical protein